MVKSKNTNSKKFKNKRMYFLTLRSLSGISKSIQAGHAALEYVSAYKNDKDLWDFINNHKTWIVLNGGSTITMEDHMKTLDKFKIKYAIFNEPDLNDSITAICFILEEDQYNIYEDKYDVGQLNMKVLKTFEKNIEIFEWIKGFQLASN